MNIETLLNEIKKAWKKEEKQGEKEKKRLEIISRIIINCAIISAIILIISFFKGDGKTIIFTIICLVIFWIAMAYSIIFKIPDIHLGLPSSIFSGRIKRSPDKDNFSVPIRKPYKEGLHIKLPWWTVKVVPRSVFTKVIEKREYPVKNGSISVKGTVQYRPSSTTLYRFVEYSERDIDTAMDSEIENIIRCRLAGIDAEDCIAKVHIASKELWNRLAGHSIIPEEAEEIEENGKKTGHIKTNKRKLWGKEITYSEHSYGVETLKAKIDTIDPSDNLTEARDSQQKENYIKKQKEIQFKYILERARDLKKDFPNLSEEQILDAIQLWEKQSTKHTNKLEIKDMKTLIPLIKELFEVRKK